MKMLALEVEFLTGRYTATDFRDRDRAEWPPHPSRLFSALVAAAYESGLGESARAALLWLESLPPPHIYADEAPAAQSPVTAYVPVNDPAGPPLPQRAERQPRSFPSVVPHARAVGESPVVYFVWPEAQPDEVLLRLLGAVAENVTYLGSSRSLVRVRLADRAPAPNWIPDEEGKELLRVPGKGRLERLEWHYQNGLRPPAGAFQRYTRGPSRQEAATPESAFDEMVVYRLGDPVTMEIETALKLTESLRAAAMRRAQDATGVVPELLSGHDEKGRPSSKTHAAYVALPFVSETQVHADGHVLGMAVVLPRGIPAQQRRQLIRPLVGLDYLNVSGVGRLDVQRLTPDMPAPQLNLRPKVWEGPARRWASVTPVLLDRFPKRSGRGLGKVLARSCEHVGLPHPVEVSADRHSPLFGVEPSSRFVTKRPTPGGPKARLYTHVTLMFAEPVRGPILLGAGRYFGLGLLRPLEEGRP
jgi:CRISPR-associated protein Csb2